MVIVWSRADWKVIVSLDMSAGFLSRIEGTMGIKKIKRIKGIKMLKGKAYPDCGLAGGQCPRSIAGKGRVTNGPRVH